MAQIKMLLNTAAFDGRALNEVRAKHLLDQGENLLEQAKELGNP